MISAIKPLYSFLAKIEEKLYKGLTFLGIVFLSLVVLAVIFQVFYRDIIIHFVSFSVSFTEEFSRYGIIWSTYLLLPICLKEGRHATVTVLIDRAKNSMRYGLYFLIQLISLSFFCVTCVYSFKNLLLTFNYLSPAMQMPGIFVFSSVTVGLILACFQILVEIIGVLSGTLEPFPKPAAAGEPEETIGGLN